LLSKLSRIVAIRSFASSMDTRHVCSIFGEMEEAPYRAKSMNPTSGGGNSKYLYTKDRQQQGLFNGEQIIVYCLQSTILSAKSKMTLVGFFFTINSGSPEPG
jgi:hypothetical protein